MEGIGKDILQELELVYIYGALRNVNATNTEENLLQYFLYGNRKLVNKNPDKYLKSIFKDYKRGNTILFVI